MVDAEPPGYPIESVRRALRLLTLIAERGPISVSVAAEELGVARSTAHRMFSTLVSGGFADQDPATKAYGSGTNMLKVGLAAIRQLDVRQAARPEIEHLRDQLGETVHLVLLDNTHVLFVDSAESNRAVRVGSRTGVRLPAHLTASGKAILAGLPDDALDVYLSRVPAGMTLRSMTDIDAIRAEIALTAARGWGTNFEESEDGLSAVAAAIPDPSGQPRASITVSVPASRLPAEKIPEIAQATLASATAIGVRLIGGTRIAAEP